MHEHNIAWLSHITLLNAKEDSITHELNPDLQQRMSRLLLIVNEIEHFIRKWTQTPRQYRDAFENWRRSRPAGGYLPHFDFVQLRKTPFIEARTSELICPVMPFFLAKIVDEPYFILSECCENRCDFQTALGLAYENYAQTLIDRIAKRDIKGPWRVIHNPPNNLNEEFCDSYLTHGMWQQSINGKLISSWAKRETGASPKNLFPTITYLTELKVDEISRVAYLDPLIEKAKLYNDSFWKRPEWLHISDLEALAELAEHKSLDLEGLLEEKAAKFPKSSFGDFLYYRFNKRIIIDSKLEDASYELIPRAAKSFFYERLGDVRVVNFQLSKVSIVKGKVLLT